MIKITPKRERLLAIAYEITKAGQVMVGDELDPEITALVGAGYLEGDICGGITITDAGRKRLMHEVDA